MDNVAAATADRGENPVAAPILDSFDPMTNVNYPGQPGPGPAQGGQPGGQPPRQPAPAPSEYQPLRSPDGLPLATAGPVRAPAQNPQFPDGSYGADFRAAPMLRRQKFGCVSVLAVVVIPPIVLVVWIVAAALGSR